MPAIVLRDDSNCDEADVLRVGVDGETAGEFATGEKPGLKSQGIGFGTERACQ